MSNPWEEYTAPASQGAEAAPWDDYAPKKEARPSGPLKLPKMAPNSPDNLAGRTLAGGALGVADIGNTVLNAVTAPVGKLLPSVAQWNRTRNADFDALTRANDDSTAFTVGRIGGNVAATAPVGGVIGGGVKALAALPRLSAVAPALLKIGTAISTAGMRTGSAPATTLAGKAADIGTRAIGGAVSGGASSALVDPEHAGTGALIGAALPGVARLAIAPIRAAGRAITGGGVAPEVVNLAKRAAELGIDVPADRIANSKLLNAGAASLNYLPFSGRSATERTMQSQLNRALSRTFGQDTDNVTMGLRKARTDLGGQFDRTLQANTVRADAPFMDALNRAGSRAGSELETGQAQVIKNQIDEILGKVSPNGEIDGQAAYNIKKTLDRIGQRITPEAFYANDLKRDLMEALNRSMTPADAAAFAATRKQYSNMLSLDKLAQNGVDGDVSIARIANMKKIGNQDLQELADISAQFLKPREGQHGAMQRVSFGTAGAALGGIPAFAGGVIAGRVANSALNSKVLKNVVMGQRRIGAVRDLPQIVYQAAPVIGSQ